MQRGARLGAIGCINDAIQRKSKACLFNRFADYRQPRSGFVQIKPMVDDPRISAVVIVDLPTRKNNHPPGKGHRLHPLDHQDQRRAAFRIVAENDHGGGGGRGRHDFAGDGVDQ